MTVTHVNTAIVGAGPAGLATAIQLARSGIEPVVFERRDPGGLLLNAHLVENYPGFPKGISGSKLARQMVKQAIKHHVTIRSMEVTDIQYQEGLFHIHADETMTSRHLVIASGTKPIQLDVPGVADVQNLYYEVKDLPGGSSRRIAIIGAGDAAFDYGLQLAKTNAVTILNRRTKPRCLPLLWQRSQSLDSIRHVNSVQVLSLETTQSLTTVRCVTNGAPFEMTFDAVLVAIGRSPDVNFLRVSAGDQESLIESGQLIFAGDVKNGIFRQCAIACGDGIRAAMTILSLQNKER